jgi:hypothetical protein
VATDIATAGSVLSTLRAQLEGRGWSFQRADGLIGDEAFLGRLPVAGPTARPSERIMIAFRRGVATGSSDWEDFADLPNRDSALGVAHIIDGRINAANLQAVPPPAEPTVRPDPGTIPAPRPGATATPASAPGPVLTPVPTSTSVVIRQLPR